MTIHKHYPKAIGLYDPRYEKDACGVGFVCNVKGTKSHQTIQQGIQVLLRLAHRGAVGADPKTGDGAGILIQFPHDFFKKVTAQININVPDYGSYGSGLVFFPTKKDEYAWCKKTFETIIKEEGQSIVGWRTVPVNNSTIGETARATQPIIEQPFIARNSNVPDQLSFERKLYIIRKRIENAIRSAELAQKTFFYITNLSSRTFSYKGLLMPDQLEQFFPDLNDQSMTSSLALVHSRYSTNTFPTWDLSQPFRFLAHNGEINTVRGNINWMKAREGSLATDVFGNDIDKLKPIIVPGGSDSATIDNAFELLSLSGRSLSHVMMMLIPVAWENNTTIDQRRKDFYTYHACFMEPWDGPAAIAFTDGTNIGAVLDRNGLRPARYVITKDDLVVMASEVGVLDIDPSNIKQSGRLEPGKLFFIDTTEGRIIHDNEVKEAMSSQLPYGTYLNDHLIDLDDLAFTGTCKSESEDVIRLMKTFGYTREDLKVIITPMAETGKEPTGSMGNDTPHAVLSKNPQLLYNYFKQLFAQVTNPAIDPIREKIVMSLESFVGSQKNILSDDPLHCHKLRIKRPVITNTDLEKIRTIKEQGFKSRTISMLFDARNNDDFTSRLSEMCEEATNAIQEGCSFIILSDRGVNKDRAAIPSLLAVGAIHHHLVRSSLRTQIGIILETAEPKEVHHFALLFGYGSDCINPYFAYDTLNYLISDHKLSISFDDAIENYRHAVETGLLKILSKMGISTLRSYRGAQIFEAIGLANDVVDLCFSGTSSRIGGATLPILAQETIQRHTEAYTEDDMNMPLLNTGGLYQWKRDGEKHLWSPEAIAFLQESVRKNDYKKYQEFAHAINNQDDQPTTIRSLFRFKKQRSIPLDKVESIESIAKRFVTGAMSFGSISKGAHETLAIAMNRIGGRSNTGEGGEDPARFTPLPNGDSKRSSIKQVASGRFGVSMNYLVNADELQIKIAQGAKPGEGGQLPGHKVSAIIARTRYTTPGVTLISPPPHHDIYSIEDLAQLIFDLKNANPQARISVKLVSEVGVGTVAAGVAKGHADMILISGGDGGTGASPLSSIRHVGLPFELGISETHQTLVLNDLRSRVRLQTDGQMRTGRDVAIAALLGAEEYGFSTAGLIVMGCVMLRHCHLNSCSLGVATQDPILQKKFRGMADYVVSYFHFVAQELREIMAELGVSTINEMIGRTDFLEVHKEILPWKAKDLDLSKILYKPEVTKETSVYCTTSQVHDIHDILDNTLIQQAQPALDNSEPVHIKASITNVNRTTGTMLSGEVCKRFGEEGLPEDTIYCSFKGIAGQSFGAWLANGVTFELEGMANDYIGKGISGGKIIVYPGKQADYIAENNIIIGNTTFYGAIAGEAYIRGIAGERFCIRNSGLYAVVEGVGDHGCEYMTGGRVVVIGPTGKNFGAGMSGGIAYVYDENGTFNEKINLSMVELEELSQEDIDMVIMLLHNHLKYTKSTVAQNILENIKRVQHKFIKVMPIEYKRILSLRQVDEKLGLNLD